MANRQRIKQDGKYVYVDTDTGDATTNPYFSCETTEVKDQDGNVLGKAVLNWMAFDPKYGPENEQQIEWHVAHGTPGAEKWEVGVPL
jgi:hypothetical protein